MENLSKQEAVLLGLLCQLRREVLRTKFVKLVYLLDNLYFENMSTTLSGFTYHWDHYGPNTVGSALVAKLAELASKGLVADIQKLTPYENYANYYRCTESVRVEKLPLSDTDWAFIRLAIKKYGRLSREAIVAESKRTAPMQNITQYDILQFRPNAAIEELKRAFLEDKAFIRDTQKALTPSGECIELGELREELAGKQAVLR